MEGSWWLTESECTKQREPSIKQALQDINLMVAEGYLVELTLMKTVSVVSQTVVDGPQGQMSVGNFKDILQQLA